MFHQSTEDLLPLSDIDIGPRGSSNKQRVFNDKANPDAVLVDEVHWKSGLGNPLLGKHFCHKCKLQRGASGELMGPPLLWKSVIKDVRNTYSAEKKSVPDDACIYKSLKFLTYHAGPPASVA